MAFFKFRKGGDEQPAANAAPQSVEALRKRAKYRLIGAAVLVLLAVIVFPLLFETQPRPVAVDIPIVIPDKGEVAPPTAARSASVAATQAAASASTTPSAQTPGRIVAGDVGTPAVAPATTVASNAPEAVAQPSAAPKPAATSPEPAKPASTTTEPAKPAAEASARYVVQVGAFSEVSKAREARLKVERAGLKTYTQVVQSPQGQRIRVRVGPFSTKALAEKAAEKIKKLNLPASVLEL